LSDAELEARICELAEKLTADWRNRRMSVAAIEADTSRSADDPQFAALFAEAQAPAFDAARFLAAVRMTFTVYRGAFAARLPFRSAATELLRRPRD